MLHVQSFNQCKPRACTSRFLLLVVLGLLCWWLVTWQRAAPAVKWYVTSLPGKYSKNQHPAIPGTTLYLASLNNKTMFFIGMPCFLHFFLSLAYWLIGLGGKNNFLKRFFSTLEALLGQKVGCGFFFFTCTIHLFFKRCGCESTATWGKRKKKTTAIVKAGFGKSFVKTNKKPPLLNPPF